MLRLFSRAHLQLFPHCIGALRARSSAIHHIVAVESSCDDSCVALMDLSPPFAYAQRSAGQMAAHAPYGGVVPPIAARAHAAKIPSLLGELTVGGAGAKKALAIAVTVGPGLSPCLRVGVSNAHRFSLQHNVPIVPIHHIEAHTLVARHPSASNHAPQFPFVALVVTGGHTQLMLAREVGKYTLLGETLDDAVGEAFDKVARMLNLSHPTAYGAAIEAAAADWSSRLSSSASLKSVESLDAVQDKACINFPIPMRHVKNCDLSFAGLKTSVKNQISQITRRDGGDSLREERVQEIAFAFQKSAATHLVERTKRAVDWARKLEPKTNQLVVCGGVASNQFIRQMMLETMGSLGVETIFPHMRYCTDNAVMVAWAAYEKIIHAQRVNSLAGRPLSLEEAVRSLSIPTLVTPENESIDDATLRKMVSVIPRWPLCEPLNEEQIAALNAPLDYTTTHSEIAPNGTTPQQEQKPQLLARLRAFLSEMMPFA
eukprot:TRINITY_DN4559_c0_g2_i1.p1 TRINITY_DN4559_c0_g2~~TRINITY_DN4559_c0_g2_i1.p1  ORF type:complete len:486 (-),score=90.56 TRINITY_DN4559_c0_g2_i1:175-1632(-)